MDKQLLLLLLGHTTDSGKQIQQDRHVTFLVWCCSDSPLSNDWTSAYLTDPTEERKSSRHPRCLCGPNKTFTMREAKKEMFIIHRPWRKVQNTEINLVNINGYAWLWTKITAKFDWTIGQNIIYRNIHERYIGYVQKTTYRVYLILSFIP